MAKHAEDMTDEELDSEQSLMMTCLRHVEPEDAFVTMLISGRLKAVQQEIERRYTGCDDDKLLGSADQWRNAARSLRGDDE